MDYEPIHSAGFLDITKEQLVTTFVEPFDVKKRREYLLERFDALVDRFKETGLNAELWIDGSFATLKPEPGDIDLIFFVDANDVNSLQADKQRIIMELNNRTYSNIRYNCDVFIVLNQDLNKRSYWRGWFGFSRNEEPKGIIRLYI
ncbi:DUF6932 family protein [Marinilabilia salmonicolor]|jgi:hypothetical protein|uniref:Nucleotidyltransferase-like protein n=1 Tax=Marinilabilia salmonicolor TaxID=989 RepID=A0A368UIX3_9BACT|nr:hypothetical protein [Marinilabilia salmonicolor]RCW23131.1 hypothetical protein DFO77_1497 [Marinilabilia salmonicolor]